MHGIEEGLLDKGCAEASDLLYLYDQMLNLINYSFMIVNE